MTDRKGYAGPVDTDVSHEDLAQAALVRPVRDPALIVPLFDRSMGAVPRGAVPMGAVPVGDGTRPSPERGVAS